MFGRFGNGFQRISDYVIAVRRRSGGGNVTIRLMHGFGFGRSENHHPLLHAQIAYGNAHGGCLTFKRCRLVHVRYTNRGANTSREKHVTARLGFGGENQRNGVVHTRSTCTPLVSTPKCSTRQ